MRDGRGSPPPTDERMNEGGEGPARRCRPPVVRRHLSVRPFSCFARLLASAEPRRSFSGVRKLVLLLVCLLIAHVALLFAGPSGESRAVAADAVTVGVVFDVGGRGDKSFNDGAYLGAGRAMRELEADVRFIEPGEGSDREAGLRLLAAQDVDLVIGVGFIFTDDLTTLAEEYPGVAFAGVDYSLRMDDAG